MSNLSLFPENKINRMQTAGIITPETDGAPSNLLAVPKQKKIMPTHRRVNSSRRMSNDDVDNDSGSVKRMTTHEVGGKLMNIFLQQTNAQGVRNLEDVSLA